MKNNHYISFEIQDFLSLLYRICQQEIINYPIEFEMYRASDRNINTQQNPYCRLIHYGFYNLTLRKSSKKQSISLRD